MTTQIGRISGALLKDNLLRDGIDLAFEDDLLYLDVNNLKIGIRTSSPTRDLQSQNDFLTTNLITDQADIADIEINNDGSISTLVGDLNISAANNVSATRIGAGNIEVDDNRIYTTVTNQDLEIQLFDATRKVKTVGDTEIIGNLHTTGDITLDGDITFGTDSGDAVIFASDIDSNIVPDLNNIYSLGDSSTRRWSNTYAGLLNGLIITAGSITPGTGIFPSVRQGNIWYVAANGNDSNVGNHQNGPFASLEKALSVAIDGDQVLVYPGEYDELLPLVVPSGVSVKGMDVRNTIIKPDTASTNEDVFLLNGETTISDITIKNFYYDSINDKGYAFRFASGFKVTKRSPYIQNVTVITKGSVTSPSDPRGFLTGDAGKGVLLDGSVADIETNEASCLFSSVTFITPGVDALTMINGVRVEWLNCFTYFADRGMYAIRGTGRTIQDGSTKQYGAEVRSIGSANVYGNYGAIADGADTLMYLINHNFAYIGTGRDFSNDKLLVIQANEVVELNAGQIHYTSMDHAGTFRVGDVFYVDIENATTSIDTSGLTVGSIVGLNITDGTNSTFIDATVVNTGNISVHDNTVESLTGEINIASASGEVNLQDNTFMQHNLSMTGNFSIGGNLTLGNDSGDTIIILPEIEENFEPNVNNIYDLGSQSKNWRDIYTRTAQISDINIDTNVIKTTISNANLELRASGVGAIWLEDIRINQNVLSTGAGGISISSATTLDINANTNINNTVNVTQDLNFDDNIRFGIDSSRTINFRSSVNSSIIPYYTDTYSLGTSTLSWNLYGSNLLVDSIQIQDNFIRTTESNANLELRANGTGGVLFEQTRFNEKTISTTSGNLILNPATTLDIFANTNITANLSVTGNVNADGNIIIGDQATDIVVVAAEINSDVIPSTNDLFNLGSPNRRWKNVLANVLEVDDVEINTNYIRTQVSNSDLELYGNGIGGVLIESTRFRNNTIEAADVNQNIEITLTGTSIVDLNTTTGLTLPQGPSVVMTSGGIRFNTTESIFTGQASARTAFGGVYSDNRLTRLVATPTSNELTFTISATQAMNVDSSRTFVQGLTVDSITINSNTISTNNINLNLTPDGTATVDVFNLSFDDAEIRNNSVSGKTTIEHTGTGYLRFTGTTGIKIPAGTDAERPGSPEQGTVRWSTDQAYLEIYIGTSWSLATSAGLGLASAAQIQELGDIWTLILG